MTTHFEDADGCRVYPANSLMGMPIWVCRCTKMHIDKGHTLGAGWEEQVRYHTGDRTVEGLYYSDFGWPESDNTIAFEVEDEK